MTLRLFLHVASLEARQRMSYRVDFWLNAVVSFAVTFGVAWFVWKAMFAESGRAEIGGYTFEAMIIYSVAVLLFGKIVQGVAFDNHVSMDIYEGDLNRYLVFPTSYFGMKYAQHLGSLLPALVQGALFGAAAAWLVGGTAEVAFTPLGLLLCVVSLLVGNLLYFLMSFPLQATAFWADNVWSLMVMLRFVSALLGGIMFPLALLPDWLRSANEWLPFRSLFALPAEALMGRIGVAEWASAMLVALAWVGLFAWIDAHVWRRGNLQYSGIGI